MSAAVASLWVAQRRAATRFSTGGLAHRWDCAHRRLRELQGWRGDELTNALECCRCTANQNTRRVDSSQLG